MSKKKNNHKLYWITGIVLILIILFFGNLHLNKKAEEKEITEWINHHVSELESLLKSHDALILEVNKYAYNPEKEEEYVEATRKYISWINENKSKFYEFKSFLMLNSGYFKEKNLYDYSKEIVDETIDQINSNEEKFREVLVYADNYYFEEGSEEKTGNFITPNINIYDFEGSETKWILPYAVFDVIHNDEFKIHIYESLYNQEGNNLWEDSFDIGIDEGVCSNERNNCIYRTSESESSLRYEIPFDLAQYHSGIYEIEIKIIDLISGKEEIKRTEITF